MNAINLNCLTFGDPVDRIFPVKVARTETVGELRKLIKKEKDPLFNNIPADELLLWLVSLPANDTALKNLSLENKLNPVDEIWEIVGDTSLNKKHVHIIEHYINFNDSHKDKSTIPTYLFLSGAGTGKSRNANEFRKTAVESLSSDDSELASTLRTRLSGAWVFNVSFETGNSMRHDESNPYLAIANRMLLQLLPNEDMGYIARNFVPPEPLDVLKIVAKHEKRDLGEIT
ncbi:hypothetical protein BC938DRAFT_474961, partial [Jimgerdemannia flammicorona]